MNTPTYSYSESNGGGRHSYDYENPFAFATESGRREEADRMEGGRGMTTASGAMAAAMDGPRRGFKSSTKRHRWNIILRLSTFGSCLAAVLLIAFGHQTSSVKLTNGTTADATAKYKYISSFVFLLWVNVVVCVYTFALTMVALMMIRKGTGTTPPMLLLPVLILNVIACCFLLLSFAAALSVEVVNRRGITLTGNQYYIKWEPVCDDFHMFCSLVEAALGSTIVGFLHLVAATSIDAYDIYQLKL